MKFRYLGVPVSNWYGHDLTPGMVVDFPDHLTLKAKASPLFEATRAHATEPGEETELDREMVWLPIKPEPEEVEPLPEPEPEIEPEAEPEIEPEAEEIDTFEIEAAEEEASVETVAKRGPGRPRKDA